MQKSPVRFEGGSRTDAAEGLERYHIEVKRVERLNVSEAMRQAMRDAAGRVPVVVHRKNRG